MKAWKSLGARTRVPAAALLLAVAAPAFGVGCDNADTKHWSGAASSESGSVANRTGSLSFELTTPSGFTFTSFTYTIVGPNFSKAGNVNVSHSTTISALIDDLPPGPGYTMTLMGTAGPPNQTTCSGSSPFSVAAGQITDVSVALSCHLLQAQPPPAAVPVPPYAPVALGFVLLALGTLFVGRRRETA